VLTNIQTVIQKHFYGSTEMKKPASQVTTNAERTAGRSADIRLEHVLD